MSALGSTAEVCAALRTISGADPFAARFLRGPRVTSLAWVRPLRPLLRVVAARLVDGALAYEIARTRHLDGVVAAELERGVRQLVLLGAGFDSRGHRFPLATFEVDVPAMSRRKRALAGGLPGRVAYVEADLEQDELLPRLTAAGFDTGAPTLVLWIGVSMYVSAAAVERAVAFAAALAPGSLLVFDYVFAPPPPDFTNAVDRRGEPVRFWTDDVDALVERAGLRLEAVVQPADLATRYLDGFQQPYRFIALAHARAAGAAPQRRYTEASPPT